MIIFPDTNLPPQSADWTDKVEFEIKKLDKRPIGGGGGDSGTGTGSGPQGPAGPQGPQGIQGPQGPEGPQGPQGDPGSQGEQGIQGIQGERGLQGLQGVKGDTGDQGLQGAKGDTGAQGIQGVKGDTGAQGIQGVKGDTGATGAQGIQGIQGETGPKGDTGAQGIQGVKGDTGNTGATGAKGDTGLTGLSAYQVAQLNGFTGTESEWLASLVGADGADGADGATGATGPAGPGVAAGGSTGQFLTKVDGTDYNTTWSSTAPSAGYTSVVKHEVKLGEAIAKGQAVYVSSADGTNMVVSKASNAAEATSSKTMGLLEAGGSTNAKVNVITEGLLTGLDTSTATVGDAVWLGTNGNLIFWHYGGSTTKPSAPNHLVFIGIVTRVNANNGEIFVKPQNGFELEELHNLQVSAAVTGNTITYNGSGQWIAGQYDYSNLSSIPSTFAPSAHTHSQSDVTGLVSALAGKAVLTGDQTFTGLNTFTNSGTGAKPIVVNGVTGTSVNLQEWQVNGGLLSFFDQSGNLHAPIVASTTLGLTTLRTNYDTNGLGVVAGGAAQKGLVIRGAASQSANLQEWQNSAGSVVASIDSAGATNLAARLLITAQNSGSTNLYLRGANASQTADLALYQTSGATTLGGRNANAQIYTGSTAPILTAVGGATTAASGTGIVATITLTSASNAAVGDLITVAGVTPTGYNGTFVVTAVSNTSPFTVSYANATTGSQTVAGTVSLPAQDSVTARSAGTKGITVKGATSQVANLQEWQNSSGTVLTKVASNGLMTVSSDSTTAENLLNIVQNPTTGTSGVVSIYSTGDGWMGWIGTRANLTRRYAFESNPTGDSGANFSLLHYNSAGASSKLMFQTSYTNGMQIDKLFSISASASTVPVYVKAAASQTADLHQWQNSAATVLTKIASDGSVAITNNLQVGSNTAILGGGAKVIGISNATTVPTSNPTGGGVLYAEGGALKWRGSSGTITVIAPA